MVVTWSTMADTESVVNYGPSSGHTTFQATGFSTEFVDGGTKHHTQYIHRVLMKGLSPGKEYTYYVGSKYGWSKNFNFKAMPKGNNWSPRLVMFGDMGNVNAQSLPRLLKTRDTYDAVLHIGDFAYDMQSDNGTVGDKFMNQIQPIAAQVPYMTCPGNHENAYNFSNYRNRFTMPEDEMSDRMFYSFNMGPAHIISLNTEFYYYLFYGYRQVLRQFDWLEQDLKEASSPQNRTERPWIITMGHRPMYCSNNDSDDCTKRENAVRIGIPYIHFWGLEKLFEKYGVDIALWAHEHSYERLWPVYNWKVYNGSYNHPYTNPGAPVHVITGSAGCQERHDKFKKVTHPWSAYRNIDYGYALMQIHNNTHVSFEQISDDKNGTVIDSFTLIKDKHQPYGLGDV